MALQRWLSSFSPSSIQSKGPSPALWTPTTALVHMYQCQGQTEARREASPRESMAEETTALAVKATVEALELCSH